MRRNVYRFPVLLLSWASMLAASAFLLPVPTLANMAAPWTPGDVVGEPSADLAGLAIEHELLELDLRSLEDGSLATVAATYQLRNDGADRTVDLVFVAPDLDYSGAIPPAVTIDGLAVAYEAGQGGEYPWQPPRSTPGIGGGPKLYMTTADGLIRFTMTIPSGRHDVAVRYSIRPATNSESGPTRLWQVGYVLAPARQWADFGSLDVAVHVPPGWAVASEPALERRGDTLVGTFQGVPADSLGISAQAPAPPVGLLQMLAVVGVLAIGFVTAWLVGAELGRRGRGVRWLLPVSILYGFIAPILISVAAIFASDLVPARQRSVGYDPGSILAVLSAPLVLIVVIVGMQVVAIVARSRVVPARWPAGHPPPWPEPPSAPPTPPG